MSEAHEATMRRNDTRVTFGFWIYLMTDCVLFASLFATYVVMQGATAGGPSSRELFDTWFVLGETLLLLTSSFTCGLAILAMRRSNKNQTALWLIITALLGAGFLAMELTEFAHLVQEGYSWQRSGFLSAFFTLVGTHGLHITVGLIWILTMLYKVWTVGLTGRVMRKLTLLSLFWHFLDVIWIFIFTIVYMIGAL